jgi:signal transduction histidine kinase
MTKALLTLLFSLALFTIGCQKKSSINISDKKRELDIKNRIDTILALEASNTDSALKLYKQRLKDCSIEKFDYGINKYYKFIVFNLCIYQNKFEDASAIAKEHLAFAKNKESNNFIADAYSSIALTFITRDITDSAAYYYLNAIDYAKKENDTIRLNGIYKNIIKVYLLQKQYEKGLKYALLNLDYAKLKNDTTSITSIYNNISIIYKGLNDTLQWKYCIDESYKLINYIDNPSLKLAVFSSKATYYLESNNSDSALYFFHLSETLSNQLKDTFHLTQAYFNKANCKLKMQNMATALFDLNIAKKLASKVVIPLEKARDFEQFSYEIYKATGNLNLALDAKEKYSILDDSMYKINSSKIYSETEIKIRDANFDKKNSENNLMITKRNNIIALLCISILSLSLISILFYFNQKRKRVLQESNIVFLKKEYELTASNTALEAQLEERNRISREIHDELGASLTSIALTTDLLRSKLKGKTEEVDKISNTSSAMVDSLNEIIWSLSSGNDSFKSLMAYTRKMFINLLEDTTIKHQFYTPVLENDFSISGSARRAIYLTIKEALNNAIKHSKATTIELSFEVANEISIVIIKDNGIGIFTKSEFGNGLINMQKNIEKIGGDFAIINENGTAIKITYPVK